MTCQKKEKKPNYNNTA